MNNNQGSGGYTLYRDTVAPSGTVSINSGVTMASTQLHLTLSATNATSGARARSALRSISSSSWPRYAMRALGITSRSRTWAAVATRMSPCSTSTTGASASR